MYILTIASTCKVVSMISRVSPWLVIMASQTVKLEGNVWRSHGTRTLYVVIDGRSNQ